MDDKCCELEIQSLNEKGIPTLVQIFHTRCENESILEIEKYLVGKLSSEKLFPVICDFIVNNFGKKDNGKVVVYYKYYIKMTREKLVSVAKKAI